MALKTVLRYVQDALSIMDSDSVDSIGDTEESSQLADLFANVYEELINRRDWEFLRAGASISGAADVNEPTKVLLPENLRHLLTLWYDISDDASGKLRELCYLEPQDFLKRFSQPRSDTLKVALDSGIIFHVRTNRMPEFYTNFGETSLYCDSVDQGIETVLTTSRISSYGIVTPSFTLEDSFVPVLPAHMVPLLTHTFNSAASATMRQAESPADEIRTARMMAQLSRKSGTRLDGFEEQYHGRFGRK